MTDTVRAKFVCSSITQHANQTSRTIRFTAQYDMSIPEDRRFQKATPWGEFTMQIDNPAVVDRFKLGQAYYLDMFEAPQSVV